MRTQRLRILVLVTAVATASGATFALARSSAGSVSTRWSVTDLGVIAAGTPLDVNSRGEIVGSTSIRRTGENESVHAFLWRDGRRRDLGTLSLGGRSDMPTMSEAVAISDSSQVIGKSYINQNDPAFVAFIWAGGKMGRLECPTTQTMSVATAINARGQIAGWCSDKPGGHTRAVVWQKTSATLLPALGASSEALAIDAHGRAVGTSGRHAVLWQNGKLTDLGPGTAVAINERGQIAGTSNDHAVLWQSGRKTDLGTLRGWRYSEAVAINALGQVIGLSFRSWDARVAGDYRAFVWQGGRVRDLGTLGGRSSGADAINDRGQIVGQSMTRDGRLHAFVWEDGRIGDLGTLAPATTPSAAVAINDRGDVVGWSSPRAGKPHALLWRRR